VRQVRKVCMKGHINEHNVFLKSAGNGNKYRGNKYEVRALQIVDERWGVLLSVIGRPQFND
jgi:hypothetical protein